MRSRFVLREISRIKQWHDVKAAKSSSQLHQAMLLLELAMAMLRPSIHPSNNDAPDDGGVKLICQPKLNAAVVPVHSS